MKKIKVLYLIDTLEMGGAENSLVDITSKFSNVEPVFIQIYAGDSLKHKLIENGIRVYSLDFQEKYGYKKVIKKVLNLIKEINPDVIHATLFRSVMISRKLKKTLSIPLVNSFTSNSYINTRYKNLSYLRRLKLRFIQWEDWHTANLADIFVSNSKVIKENNIRILNIEEKKILVIPRGRDSTFFDAKNYDRELIKKEMGYEGKRILINVGRLIESKGQIDLIQAFEKVSKDNPELLLLIAGEGKFRRDLEEKIKNIGLSDKILLLGNRQDIPKLLAISDLFVFPTYLEGLPGSLIEAMMSKTPVICSNIPENKECVPDKGAYFFNPGDITELTKLIQNCLDKPDNLDLMIQLSYNYAIKNFELENISERYENVYYDLLSLNK